MAIIEFIQSNEAKPSDCAKCDDQVRKMVEFRSMGGVTHFGQEFNFKTTWTFFWISSLKVISNRFETLVERSGVQRRKFWWVFELKRTTTQKVTAKKRIFWPKNLSRARTFGEGVKFEHYLFWPKNEVSEATQSKFLINLYPILSFLTPLR